MRQNTVLFSNCTYSFLPLPQNWIRTCLPIPVKTVVHSFSSWLRILKFLLISTIQFNVFNPNSLFPGFQSLSSSPLESLIQPYFPFHHNKHLLFELNGYLRTLSTLGHACSHLLGQAMTSISGPISSVPGSGLLILQNLLQDWQRYFSS